MSRNEVRTASLTRSSYVITLVIMSDRAAGCKPVARFCVRFHAIITLASMH